MPQKELRWFTMKSIGTIRTYNEGKTHQTTLETVQQLRN